MYDILSNRSVIRIKGQDAEKFLQGLTTNDVMQHSYSYNYMLTNQGRYLHDFFAFKENKDSFLIDVANSSLSEMLKRLNLYKLRSNVEINGLSNEFSVIYTKALPNFEHITSNQDPRSNKLGFRVIVDTEKTKGLPGLVSDLYLEDKYKYSIPDGEIDLIYDKSIPIEYGADELSAVSYSKGCYVGQEVISRAKYQGVVRKKLYKVLSSRELPSIDKGSDVLDLEGNKIGVFCSNYKLLGIVLLREEKYLGLAEKVAMINNVRVDISVPEWRK